MYKQFVSSGSIEKKARTGRSIKISERGERIVEEELKFGTLKEAVKEVHQSDVCRTAIKCIIRKIAHK